MSDGLKYWADRESEEYARKHGSRDRNADKMLDELRALPSAQFTVEELRFLLNPPRNSFQPDRWTEDSERRLREIYQRVIRRANP